MNTLADIKNRCRVDENGCWNWIGATAAGYGRFKKRSCLYSSHREAFRLANPLVDISHRDVCHHCDNRKCCNPDHLFCGTRSENMIDCRDKGRLPRQTAIGHGARCGAEFVGVIKYLKASGIPKRHIAAKLGWTWASFQRYEKRHAI